MKKSKVIKIVIVLLLLMVFCFIAVDSSWFAVTNVDTKKLNEKAIIYYKNADYQKAEPLMKQALSIDEANLGKDHPEVAIQLNNLALLYQATNRLSEAEPLMKRVVEISIDFTRRTGHRHPHLMDAANNYTGLLVEMGDSKDQARAKVIAMAPDLFGQ